MPSSRARDGAEWVRLRVLLCGLYAWAATVLSVVVTRGVPLESRLGAGVALSALGAGAVLLPARPALGRALSLHVFIGACLGAWLTLGPFLAVERLDPLRAALGGLGWVMFALAWGTPREVSRVPEDDPHVLPGEPLQPRGALAPFAVAVLAVAVVGAGLPLAAAWRVGRSPHALLAHAVAVLAAIAVVSAGARIALHRGRWKPVVPPSRRLGQAMIPLLAVVVLALVGVIGLLTP
jgi:hypothetical protein